MSEDEFRTVTKKACGKSVYEVFDHVFRVRENAGHKSSGSKYLYKTHVTCWNWWPEQNSTKSLLIYCHFQCTKYIFVPHKWRNTQSPASHYLRKIGSATRDHFEMFFCLCVAESKRDLDSSTTQSERMRAINFYYFMSLDIEWIRDELNWAAAWHVNVDYLSNGIEIKKQSHMDCWCEQKCFISTNRKSKPQMNGQNACWQNAIIIFNTNECSINIELRDIIWYFVHRLQMTAKSLRLSSVKMMQFDSNEFVCFFQMTFLIRYELISNDAAFVEMKKNISNDRCIGL